MRQPTQNPDVSSVKSQPNFILQVLGKRLGKAMGAAAAAIRGLNTEQIAEYEAAGCITAEGVELQAGDLKVPTAGPGSGLSVRLQGRGPGSRVPIPD